jgi:acetyl-CoA acetyltransferase
MEWDRPMDVLVLGAAVHPPAAAIAGKRLEEIVFDTTYAALADAGVKRAEIDHVTIAASDELDGRAISSMLLAMPAGAYLRDETKCTDSGLTGLCLGAMRIASGVFNLGLVVSWNKTSEAPVEDVMLMRGEPFFTRPIGLNMAITDGLFAQATAERFQLTPGAADRATMEAYARAQRNPRGMQHAPPTPTDLKNSNYVATPLRQIHRAPITDGAVAMVIASPTWVRDSGGRTPKARVTGLGWRNERYYLGAERLSGLAGFTGALDDALRSAGNLSLDSVDVLELDAQTAYHQLAYESVLPRAERLTISPAGGAFAQNPYFCTGLVNAVEAMRQVSNSAGLVQRPGARRAIAHGAHGFAQQGNVAVVLEGV